MHGHNGCAGHGGGHANFADGVAVDHAGNGFDPHEIVRDFDWGTTTRVIGRVVRSWELDAVDKEIELMPGVKFVAWTCNGRIGGASSATLVAAGIGLHNLGEGVAIGAAYAAGALTLGPFLVIGFAIHNTTEGLAIVAPLARARTSFGRLLGLGLLAGAPAVLGAWIGAGAYNASFAAFLFGFGAGAIVQVVVTLVPALRDDTGRTLHPTAVTGILGGMALMFATGLLVAA